MVKVNVQRWKDLPDILLTEKQKNKSQNNMQTNNNIYKHA